jgi:hypothetical protein
MSPNKRTSYRFPGRSTKFPLYKVSIRLSLKAINGRQKWHNLADKPKYSSLIALLSKQQFMARSTKIRHILARSANSKNRFHRHLMRTQGLAPAQSVSHENALREKFRLGSNPKTAINALSARLFLESHLAKDTLPYWYSIPSLETNWKTEQAIKKGNPMLSVDTQITLAALPHKDGCKNRFYGQIWLTVTGHKDSPHRRTFASTGIGKTWFQDTSEFLTGSR